MVTNYSDLFLGFCLGMLFISLLLMFLLWYARNER